MSTDTTPVAFCGLFIKNISALTFFVLAYRVHLSSPPEKSIPCVVVCGKFYLKIV